ncbi:MAG: hypothetical protein V4812_20660 [Pseudomonadota bacterium]
MNNLKLATMRKELLQYLEGLSDIEYQKKIWVAGERTEGVMHDELDYTIHFLYDDTDLATDPDSLIGWILLDKIEVDSIKELISALDRLFEVHGLNSTDEEYMQAKEWGFVISAAKTARNIIIKNDEASGKRR